MRRAVIDQILLWIVLFIAFITMFFMVINYYMVMKTKDRCDTLANYGVRMKALGRDNDDIVNGLNNITNNYFKEITTDDMECVEDATQNDYQTVFKVDTTFKNIFLDNNERVASKASTFNEVNSSHIDCNITLEVQ
jgi:hypothetical protein